jgi:Ca2+-binding EF-hand superfamily protein
MRRGVKVVGVVAVAGLAAVAQAGGGMMGPPPGMGPQHGGMGGGPVGGAGPKPAPDGRGAAMALARAADTDKSGDVTADEWTAFMASLGADASGVVPLDALAAALPLPPLPPGVTVDTAKRDAMLLRIFDLDGDGSVTTADLDALFALLDTNGDGALSKDDAPAGGGHHRGPGGVKDPDPSDEAAAGCHVGDPRKAGFLLARAADADASHDVTADEWAAFLATLGADADGVVALDALAAALPAPPHAPADPTDTTQRDAALTRAFDYDDDGAVEISDLESLFTMLDRNDDGSASKSEAGRPKPLRGAARRAGMALFRAADADDSRDVTGEEWAAFLGGIVADENGAVSLDDLASKLPAPRHAADSGDTAKRDANLVRAFDKDGDGVVTTADLQALFDVADANADGALDPTELRPKR